MIDTRAEERFYEARLKVLGESVLDNGIGRLSEKSVHRILKLYIEPDETFHEIQYLGSVADIINDDGIHEIQTRSFEKLIPKLEKFLPTLRVCVVIPIICEKTLRWLDKSDGEISAAKKSPKKESVYTACRELYKIRRYLNHPNLSIRFISMRAEEFRYLDGRDESGKRGATKLDRIPTRIVDDISLSSAKELSQFLSDSVGDEFTLKELSRVSGFPFSVASSVVGVFKAIGAVDFLRKEGRINVYKKIK